MCHAVASLGPEFLVFSSILNICLGSDSHMHSSWVVLRVYKQREEIAFLNFSFPVISSVLFGSLGFGFNPLAQNLELSYLFCSICSLTMARAKQLKDRKSKKQKLSLPLGTQLL